LLHPIYGLLPKEQNVFGALLIKSIAIEHDYSLRRLLLTKIKTT